MNKVEKEKYLEKIIELLKEKPRTRNELTKLLDLPRTTIYNLLIEKGDWEYQFHQSIIKGTGEITKKNKILKNKKDKNKRGRPNVYFFLTRKGIMLYNIKKANERKKRNKITFIDESPIESSEKVKNFKQQVENCLKIAERDEYV